MTYIPHPIDPDGAALPPELLAEMETIARNVHETWSVGRMQEGWTYGPEKDEARKKTPMLVPYEDLPDSERDFDRNTALATLRAVVSLGFTIHPPQA